MKQNSSPKAAYEDFDYLHSRHARNIRVLAEFSAPEQRFKKSGIKDTVVFFGSARTLPLKDAKTNLRNLKKNPKVNAKQLEKAQMDIEMARYYEDCVVLSRRVAEWLKERTQTWAICSGGGPGIMEAANRGAKQANFPSIGLNINLPFEQHPNPFITPALNFEFHYFFLRKYWFLYLAKALVIFPGGFGTFDEMMEALTLMQTKKLKKDITMVMYGKDFWDKVIDFDYLAKSGVIDPQDLKLFYFTNDVEDAYQHIIERLQKILDDRQAQIKSASKNFLLDV